MDKKPGHRDACSGLWGLSISNHAHAHHESPVVISITRSGRVPIGTLRKRSRNTSEQQLVDSEAQLRKTVDELKRAGSLRAAEQRTLELIADGASLPDVLNDLCSSIDAQSPGTISTILLMDPDGKNQLWHVAGPRVPRASRRGGDESRPSRRCRAGQVSRGPLLSLERVSDPAPRASRPTRRHPVTRPLPRRALRGEGGEEGPNDRRWDSRAAASLRLAGKRSRASERHRARRDPG